MHTYFQASRALSLWLKLVFLFSMQAASSQIMKAGQGGVRALRARMAGAKAVMLSVSRTPKHGSMSKIQANAIMDMLRGIKLTAEDALALSSLVMEIEFAGDDADAILQCIAPAKLEKTSKPKAKMQNYSMISQQLCEKHWEVLMDKAVNIHPKMDVICRAGELRGAHAPSEPSLKMWTSVVLFCHFSIKELMQMSAEDKHGWLECLKKRWSPLVKPPPSEYILCLPSCSADFKVCYPGTYAEAFRDDAPTTCPIDVKHLVELDSSYKCRGGGSAMKWGHASMFGQAAIGRDSHGVFSMSHASTGSAEAILHALAQTLHSSNSHNLLDHLSDGYRRGPPSHAERSLLDSLGHGGNKRALRDSPDSFPPLGNSTEPPWKKASHGARPEDGAAANAAAKPTE